MGLTRVSGDILQTPLNVGVVTASQVNVGSAVTIHSGGFQVGGSDLHSSGLTVQNLNATGVITATSFVGDGSALTGIDATALKDSGGNVKVQANTSGAVVTGVLTATSFSGDGSSLTGIAATDNIITNSLVVSGVTTASGGIEVGATTSITVGDSFIKSNSIGIGTTTTTGRNAGVGTASGSIIFNLSTQTIEAYGVGIGTQSNRSGWFPIRSIGSGISTSPGTIEGQQIFTSSGTFLVPEGVYKIRVWLTGGGGGGGTSNPAAGGTAGQTAVKTIYVTPGQSISITIGSGGKGEGGPVWLGPSPTQYGKAGNGQQSSFGDYLTAAGGAGGDGPTTANPPAGAPAPVGSTSGQDFFIYGYYGDVQDSPNNRSKNGGHSVFGIGGQGTNGNYYYAVPGWQGGGGATGVYRGGAGGSGYCLIEWGNI